MHILRADRCHTMYIIKRTACDNILLTQEGTRNGGISPRQYVRTELGEVKVALFQLGD
jgi:hypothetical protein